MAILTADILYKLSVVTGAAGNANAQADANASFGKYISTTQISEALHGLFDKVTGDENAASDVEYRCVFVHNSHGSLTLESAVVWLVSQVSGGAAAAIAVDSTAASAIGASGAQALQIDDEADSGNDLSGLTFSAPSSKGAGLALGNIPAGQCRAIWIRRTAANSAALDADGFTIRVEGDTAA